MRSLEEYREAAALADHGLHDAAIGELLDIPRSTIRDWRRRGFDELRGRTRSPGCPICLRLPVPRPEYAYLLGLYLGDGHIAEHRRQVQRLRIFLDERYPGIVAECSRAVAAMRLDGEMRVGVVGGRGCVYVSAYWKHWTCLFPQHGEGAKLDRRIVLAPWQEAAVARDGGAFIRGMIQSDGCRVVNRVRGHEYVRYMFCNHSSDIMDLFCASLEHLGVGFTRSTWRTASVARRPDVARLEEIVGAKR